MFNSKADLDPTAEAYLLESAGKDDAYISKLGYQDIFISKLDQHSKTLWIKNIGDDEKEASYGLIYASNQAQAINIDKSNHLYVSGFFKKTIDFDTKTENTTLTSENYTSSFF